MKEKTKRQPAPPEVDERVERSKKAVLAATHELLTKEGFSGVSVDEVARRSGVAKTTIYRHWPSRESLLMDACRQLSSRPPAPNTGSLKKDLEILACGVASRLQQPWSTVLPSIIDAGERDEEIADLHTQIHAQMRAAFVSVIELGQQRGEIARSQDSRELVASILGPLMYRRYFSREPLDDGFAKKVVERALRKSS